MRHASSTIGLDKVLWATLLACCLQVGLIVVADESANAKSGRYNLQMNEDMPRRYWNRNPQVGGNGWDDIYSDWTLKSSKPSIYRVDPLDDLNRIPQVGEKQGWGDLHGEWGRRKRSIPSIDQLSYSTPIVEKRAWQSLQGGWGKRYSPSESDMSIQELASILERNDNHNIPIDPEIDVDYHDDQKRNWNKFNDGWGKRNKWEKFRGSWGKRDPAWSNLKGIWGKRSVPDEYTN